MLSGAGDISCNGIVVIFVKLTIKFVDHSPLLYLLRFASNSVEAIFRLRTHERTCGYYDLTLLHPDGELGHDSGKTPPKLLLCW